MGASLVAASCDRDPFHIDRARFDVNEFFDLFTKSAMHEDKKISTQRRKVAKAQSERLRRAVD